MTAETATFLSATELERTLSTRDCITIDEARQMIQEAAEENPHDPEAALYDLGLEPDYIFDIFPYYQ